MLSLAFPGEMEQSQCDSDSEDLYSTETENDTDDTDYTEEQAPKFTLQERDTVRNYFKNRTVTNQRILQLLIEEPHLEKKMSTVFENVHKTTKISQFSKHIRVWCLKN